VCVMIKSETRLECPHCHQQVAAGEFCSKCGKILPVPETESPYKILGFSRETLVLDLADLEKRFFELSKKFHPDRFASKSQQEIQVSHDRSSSINNAYRTLKNPISRAKYFVEKELGSIEEKSAHVPPDMAEFFFEVQDVLETIRDSSENPPEDAVKEVHKAEAELMAKVADLEKDLQSRFFDYDNSPDKKKLENIKEILTERSYIKSFLRQIDSVMKGDEESA
jgi:molecular chaperone HscB